MNELIHLAATNQWLIVLIIDDFTTIHTNRRPDTDTSSTSKSMCTIVFKIFKSIQAIHRPKNIYRLHDPQGVNINALSSLLSSELPALGQTFSSIMPEWLTKQFFNPESERTRLSEHQYCEDNSIRTLRRMDDLHLIDFVELQLKSRQDFTAAYDIALSSGLKEYLKKFVIIQPGDWPCQLYCRQSVYQSLPSRFQPSETQAGSSYEAETDHSYTLLTPKKHCSYNFSVNTPDSISPITSIVPMLGPLHISLNSREHVFISFRPFFANVYHFLFPKSKLADHPKPWRISLLLEVVYGGWTIIREKVMNIFSSSKDLQYGTLLNLLDNYLPLVLSIYSITFKLNKFSEYRNAMTRIWVMFTCLQRRHYNKAPLVWLSNHFHWGLNFKELYNMLTQWSVIADEYPVENTHSIIRAQTKPSDSPEQLTNKAKTIFQSRNRQENFRSVFTPPKHFTFSTSQIKYLKVKCAQYLTKLVINIYNHPTAAAFTSNTKNKKQTSATHVTLPDLFGDTPQKFTVLPLGYHGDNTPDCHSKCDLINCPVLNESETWIHFKGCWHSFHQVCLEGSSSCPYCKTTLQNKIKSLGNTAKDTILKPNTKKNTRSSTTTSDEDSQDNETIPLSSNVNLQNLDNTITTLKDQISALGQANPPSNTNRHKAHPPPSCSSFSTQPNNLLLTRNDFPTLTEWILPPNMCQSNIFGTDLGTNACTIISVLTSMKFLSHNISLPTTLESLVPTCDRYGELMKQGNILYNVLNRPASQPNLEVTEVLNLIHGLNLRIKEDLGFFTAQDMVNKLEHLVNSEHRECGVLIVPPDKSMAVLVGDGKLGVFDSHKHGLSGGIIAIGDNIQNFVAYLELMIRRDWNGILNGANFTTLGQL